MSPRMQDDLELKIFFLQNAWITGMHHCFWLRGCGLTYIYLYVYIYIYKFIYADTHTQLVSTHLWTSLAQSIGAGDCYELDMKMGLIF